METSSHGVPNWFDLEYQVRNTFLPILEKYLQVVSIYTNGEQKEREYDPKIIDFHSKRKPNRKNLRDIQGTG